MMKNVQKLAQHQGPRNCETERNGNSRSRTETVPIAAHNCAQQLPRKERAVRGVEQRVALGALGRQGGGQERRGTKECKK